MNEPTKKLFPFNLSKKEKISVTISLVWIIGIGYLTWWNGLSNLGLDKSFRWDEWFWFGIVPAGTMPNQNHSSHLKLLSNPKLLSPFHHVR